MATRGGSGGHRLFVVFITRSRGPELFRRRRWPPAGGRVAIGLRSHKCESLARLWHGPVVIAVKPAPGIQVRPRWEDAPVSTLRIPDSLKPADGRFGSTRV